MPDEFYKDGDMGWLTSRMMEERYAIPNSRLKEWREQFCPDIGRKLRARIVTGIGWVYFRLDVHELAELRTEKGTSDDRLERLARLTTERERLIGDE